MYVSSRETEKSWFWPLWIVQLNALALGVSSRFFCSPECFPVGDLEADDGGGVLDIENTCSS